MFRSKTVFVLGAGASAEVGLPVGAGLLKRIKVLLDIKFDFRQQSSGDFLISEALRIVLDEGPSVEEFNEHLHAAWQVISSADQALSIDNIVDGLEDPRVELVSKLAIARAIQLAEEESMFFRVSQNERKLDLSNFSNTWYSFLTKILTENRRKSEIDSVFENIAFVSFNYDRCIERYLPESIASYYGVPLNVVSNIFKDVHIHRPYGIAGEIEWLSDGRLRGFGSSNAESLARSASMIRTFTEGVENPNSLGGMRDELRSAERIVFLGSAFHRQNLELLETDLDFKTSIFATTSSISDPDLEVITGELQGTFPATPTGTSRRIEFAKMHAKEFFNDYWRTLTS